jgi:vancomycin resistance protein YoaR
MTVEVRDDAAWEDEPARRARQQALLLAAAIGAGAVAAVLAYATVAAWFADGVATGTTVAGVRLGGMDAAEARSALAAGVAGRVDAPIVLTAPGGRLELDADEVGLDVDIDATVDELVGFSLSPVRIWDHLTGGDIEPAIVTIDRARFDAVVQRARGDLDAAPVDGTVSIATGVVVATAPKEGSRVDIGATRAAVLSQWPAATTIKVVSDPQEPKVTAAEIDRVRTTFADVAVSAPVDVTTGGTTFQLAPARFGSVISLTPDRSGRIAPVADRAKLIALVRAAAAKAGVEVKAKDAAVTFAGLTPRVTPSVAGVTLDDASIITQVWKAIGSSRRTATIATKRSEPAFSTQVAQRTLPRGPISSFTTNFPAGQVRVSNIKLASSIIDGTYIPPGAQFSMNGILGERTPQKGYVKAGIIRNGRAAESYGGGISQVSTTIFNAAFFSGMRLDEWTPHYYYISRYPEGREATISWPDLHNKFTNVTDGGVLIKISTTRTSITVTFYGIKKYDVSTTTSPRRNIVAPKAIVDAGPECITQTPVPGFTVDVSRVISQNGKVVKRESHTTTYRPEDDVTCTNPAAK